MKQTSFLRTSLSSHPALCVSDALAISANARRAPCTSCLSAESKRRTFRSVKGEIGICCNIRTAFSMEMRNNGLKSVTIMRCRERDASSRITSSQCLIDTFKRCSIKAVLYSWCLLISTKRHSYPRGQILTQQLAEQLTERHSSSH